MASGGTGKVIVVDITPIHDKVPGALVGVVLQFTQLGQMLSLDPKDRPAARQAWETLSGDAAKKPVMRFRPPTDDDL